MELGKLYFHALPQSPSIACIVHLSLFDYIFIYNPKTKQKAQSKNFPEAGNEEQIMKNTLKILNKYMNFHWNRQDKEETRIFSEIEARYPEHIDRGNFLERIKGLLFFIKRRVNFFQKILY